MGSLRPAERLSPGDIPWGVVPALALLVRAWYYARELQAHAWEFAVDRASLLMAGASQADLRWLALKDIIAPAVETDRDGKRRKSRKPARLALPNRSCFVLTDEGQPLARKMVDRFAAHGNVLTREMMAEVVRKFPRWDKEQKQLWVGSVLVKTYARPAAAQWLVLTAFQEECWPSRIDDPLPPIENMDPVQRLHSVITRLNMGHRTNLIRFLRDGTGHGMRWELTTADQG